MVSNSLQPHECSLSGFSVHGVLQARILERIAIPFSRGSSQLRDRAMVSCITGRFFTIWTTENSHIISCRTYKVSAKSLQSFPTLCDLIDGSPPGSPIPGILRARTLEWVAISFSNAWKWKAKVKLLSHVWLVATPWTAAHQVPASMGFSRQKYWSGMPLPSLRLQFTGSQKTQTWLCD